MEDDDLDAFIEGIDAALTKEFGPDHQKVLASGRLIHEFDWGQSVGREREGWPD